MHVDAGVDRPLQTSWLFAPHLSKAGYNVGLFGKYLNADVPVCGPPGINKWLANGGGDYYNPTFSLDGKNVRFDNGTYANYR